jgi:hypothetical protein
MTKQITQSIDQKVSRLGFNWYKWLWTRVGGRPWTFIMRDCYHQAPIPTILFLLAVGATLGKYVGWKALLIYLVVLLLGNLVGHLFWGSKYIENQQGR